jgi:arylsulfatase A-like enzyme
VEGLKAMKASITRRSFIGQALGTAAVMAGSSTVPGNINVEPEDRCNIVLIVADDHHSDLLGFYGIPELKTPNLDRLAWEGVHFTNCYTPNPICAPSRAAILTGQDCFTNGVYFFKKPFRKAAPQLGQLLSNAGYETFYTGKWHNEGRPCNFGFTSGDNIFVGAMYRSQNQTRVSDFCSEEPHEVVERYSASVFSDSAVEFLNDRKADEKPFFLYVSYTTPHDPWTTPPGEWGEMYDPKDVPIPENFMPRPMNGSKPFRFYDRHFAINQRDEQLLKPFPRTAESVKLIRSQYYRVVSYMDHQIGRILNKLDEEGLTENTMVIYVSDNGICLGAHGRSGKQSMYEEAIKVPLIIRYPRLLRSCDCGFDVEVFRAKHLYRNSRLVSLIDLLPTICEASKVEVPPKVEGGSLLSLYQGKSNWSRNHIFAASVTPQFRGPNSRATRTEQFKLIDNLATNEIELYDLENDPYEVTNLAGLKEYEGIQQKLTERLQAWRLRAEKDKDIPFKKTSAESG